MSGYVRVRIREWREAGRELQDLARKAGFAKSTPSQVLMGTGVGQKTGPRWAAAFDFPSYDAMKHAAFEWWQAQNRPPAAGPPSPAMQEAVDLVLGLKQGTPQQVATILAAYSHVRFRSRNYEWWLQTLMTELTHDRQAIRADRDERAEASAGQRVFREANRQKRESETSPALAAAQRAPKRGQRAS